MIFKQSPWSAKGGEQIFGLGVVAESLAHMDKAIDITGSKHKAAAELEWIFSQPMLAHTNGFGALAGARVIRAEEMQQVGFFEFDSAIGFTLVIDQQGKGDAGLFAKVASVTDIAQADRDKLCAFLLELLLVFAQLRDVLTAEDSTPVSQENNDRGPLRPQPAENHLVAVHVRQPQLCHSSAECFRHARLLYASRPVD